MIVDTRHGCCRSCGGQLTIVDADDATLTVECGCGDCYSVEPDAMGDGCLIYHHEIMAEKYQEGKVE